MVFQSRRIIDADGHVFEDVEGIREFLPLEWMDVSVARGFGFWPTATHLFHALNYTPPGSFVNPGPEGWVDFLDAQGLEATVLYPSSLLHMGMIKDLDLAVGVAKGYNDWLHAKYLTRDNRLKGMALLPIQDPSEAVIELRRAVEELGMCGGMLTAVGQKGELGTKEYWPIYEEADRLGCSVSLHAGSHVGLGLDHMNIFVGTNGLGHPLGIVIGFVSMLLNGVFDKYPNARYAFLEAGVGWFLMGIERCNRSYVAFPPLDPKRQYLRLAPGETVADYVKRNIKEGRISIGVEGGEPDLAYAVRTMGREAFLYSTDYPHEATKDTIGEELSELLDNEELTEEDFQAILHDNAERFYGFRVAATN